LLGAVNYNHCGMDPARGKYHGGRALKALHSGRIDAKETIFRQLEQRRGPHLMDLFASNMNNQCERFYTLHGYRGSAGVNAFAFFWGIGPVWIRCPYRLLGHVWRKLRNNGAIATVLVPLRQPAAR